MNRLWHPESEDEQDDPLSWSDVLSESEDEVMRVSSDEEVMRVPECILANTLQDMWEHDALSKDVDELCLDWDLHKIKSEKLYQDWIPQENETELEETFEVTTVASRWAAKWARPGSAAREYLQAEYDPDDIALREWEVGINNEQAMNVLTMSQDIEDVYTGKAMFMHLYHLAEVGGRDPIVPASVSDVCTGL